MHAASEREARAGSVDFHGGDRRAPTAHGFHPKFGSCLGAVSFGRELGKPVWASGGDRCDRMITVRQSGGVGGLAMLTENNRVWALRR